MKIAFEMVAQRLTLHERSYIARLDPLAPERFRRRQAPKCSLWVTTRVRGRITQSRRVATVRAWHKNKALCKTTFGEKKIKIKWFTNRCVDIVRVANFVRVKHLSVGSKVQTHRWNDITNNLSILMRICCIQRFKNYDRWVTAHKHEICTLSSKHWSFCIVIASSSTSFPASFFSHPNFSQTLVPDETDCE